MKINVLRLNMYPAKIRALIRFGYSKKCSKISDKKVRTYDYSLFFFFISNVSSYHSEYKLIFVVVSFLIFAGST